MALPQELKWTELESSNVKAAAHDADTNTLYVKFGRGAVYSYKHAPVEVYSSLIGADSVGQYLNEHIKPYYPYSLVD